MSDGMLGVKGEFRILVIDPDGSVAHDTGPMPNVITKIGMQFLLYCLAGNAIDTVPTGGTAGIDNADCVLSCALGNFGIGAGPGDYYDATELNTELSNTGYARVAANLGFGMETVATLGAEYTDPSTVVFKFKFAAGQFAAASTIDEVGLMNHITKANGNCIACKSFTEISTNASQEVQVFYTISLTQTA